jgi:hypothetical protein
MKRENITAEKNKDEETTEDTEEHGVFGKNPLSPSVELRVLRGFLLEGRGEAAEIPSVLWFLSNFCKKTLKIAKNYPHSPLITS